jgi:hypothetical protein
MTEQMSEAHLVTVADGVHAWIGAYGDSNAGAIETPEGIGKACHCEAGPAFPQRPFHQRPDGAQGRFRVLRHAERQRFHDQRLRRGSARGAPSQVPDFWRLVACSAGGGGIRRQPDITCQS